MLVLILSIRSLHTLRLHSIVTVEWKFLRNGMDISLLGAFPKFRALVAEDRVDFRFQANFHQMADYVIHSHITSGKMNKLTNGLY